MTTTFATWPRSPQGQVDFTATCPCGRDAVWEQVGVGTVNEYTISCSCRPAATARRAGTTAEALRSTGGQQSWCSTPGGRR